MKRRDFLKNSIGALLFAGLSSNKVLAKIIESTPIDSLNVLLYLIQNKNGDWKIKGTKWVDIKSARLSQFHYNLDTFKPLEIVDNTIVNNVKEKYWKEYNCKGKCPKNVNYLSSYKSGIKAKQSGQFYEAVKKSYGKTHKLYPEYWKEHGKKIGKLNVENGHIDKLYELYGKDLGKNWGKLGAKKVLENRLGIHSASKEQRKEWAKIGGKIGGKITASKHNMKEISKLGVKVNIEKYGKSVYAHNLNTFETLQFDSKKQASRYCNTSVVIINKIISKNQKSLRSGWTFFENNS